MTYYRKFPSCYLYSNSESLELISLVITRFYKEEVRGESRNYINNRAKNEGKTATKIIEIVMEETIQAYLQASNVLEGRGQYARVWREYITGYVAMHLTSTRYLLRDIGLDERFWFA